MRGRRTSVAAVVLALLAGAGPARADDYLEDPQPREGLMLSFGLGPALFVGLGNYSDFRAPGGSGMLRLGSKASQLVTFIVQTENMGFLREDPVTRVDSTQAFSINTLGVMLFVRERFWLRSGVGFASVSEDDRQGRTLDNGLGLTGALGYDVRRWGRWAINFELGSATGMMGNGSLTLFLLRVAATYY